MSFGFVVATARRRKSKPYFGGDRTPSSNFGRMKKPA
jgi:hypothetical protein